MSRAQYSLEKSNFHRYTYYRRMLRRSSKDTSDTDSIKSATLPRIYKSPSMTSSLTDITFPTNIASRHSWAGKQFVFGNDETEFVAYL